MKTHKQSVAEITKIKKVSSTFERDLIALLWNGFQNMGFIKAPFQFELNLPNLNQLIAFVENKAVFDNPTEELLQFPLGKYAEQLLAQYLKQHSPYKLLANNIQLNDSQQTVGEADFLLQNRATAARYHLEFAIKFYLKINVAGQTKYIGPNAKDSLSRKIKKLYNHQLKLFPTHTALLPEQLQHTYQPKLLLKLYVFDHIDNWAKKAQDISNEGWWCYENELKILTHKAAYFRIINDKKSWIFPYCTTTEFIDATELPEVIHSIFSETGKPIMLVRYTNDKTIIDRGFIVSSHWPDPK